MGPAREQAGGSLSDASIFGGHVVKLTLRDKESAQEAVRRFRKLVERSGIKKECEFANSTKSPAKSTRCPPTCRTPHPSRAFPGHPLGLCFKIPLPFREG